MAYVDYLKPFSIYTDGSLQGMGAVLAQVQDDCERMIAYGSCSLRPTKKNPSWLQIGVFGVSVGIHWEVCKYLTGADIEVFMDNNALAYLDTAKLGALEQRWAWFKYEIHYRLRKLNLHADALSHFLVEMPREGCGLLLRRHHGHHLKQLEKFWGNGIDLRCGTMCFITRCSFLPNSGTYKLWSPSRIFSKSVEYYIWRVDTLKLTVLNLWSGGTSFVRRWQIVSRRLKLPGMWNLLCA